MAVPAFAVDDDIEVMADDAVDHTGDHDGMSVMTETAPAESFPTKALIRDMVEQGKMNDAESSYLIWASYWKDDDPALIIPVLRGKLMDDFRNGSNASLIALAQSGDSEALNVLGAQVLAGGENWPPSDLIPAIRLIGRTRDPNALNVLRSVLYNDDPGVVNATVEALSNIGDPRIAPELLKLFDDADLERSVVLARALARLGKAKQVSARFMPQLQFPLPGVRERAALVLTAIGRSKGWPLVHHMLQTKEPPYYPLVLTTLSGLPTRESAAFVSEALSGEEAEQLAALQSLNVLPTEKSDAVLVTIMRDETRLASVRVQAIRMIATRGLDGVAAELRTLATGLGDEDTDVKGAAMMAFASFDMLKALPVREVVRQRISSDEEPVALASRAVLLSYALKERALQAKR
jgi:HEAT repeat protein